MTFFKFSIAIFALIINTLPDHSQAQSFKGIRQSAEFDRNLTMIHAIPDPELRGKVFALSSVLALLADKDFTAEQFSAPDPRFIMIVAPNSIVNGKISRELDRQMNMRAGLDHITLDEDGCNIFVDNDTETALLVLDTRKFESSKILSCVIDAISLYLGVPNEILVKSPNIQKKLTNVANYFTEK